MNQFLLILIFISISFNQQIRYLDEVFESVNKQEDIIYGNAPDLPFIFLFEWNTQNIDLEMDIYQPAGDTISSRPAIIFMHPGSFLFGNNEVDDMVSLSNTSAKRGYVSFNISYRLGMNVLSSYSGERAVYRAVQDLSAAIRFIRENHLEYNVDPNKIYVWGSSAGAMAGLHLAFLDDDERPESTYGNNSNPDLGCIDCEGNSISQSGKPNGVIACWGAIGDLDWIESGQDIPIAMFHGNLDPVVPFNSGYPFTIDIALPLVYGSNLIHDKLNSVNIENQFFVGEGEGHEYWGTLNGSWFWGPNENFYQITSESFNFLYTQIQSNQIFGDVNFDDFIDVLDIILVIDYILNDQYYNSADTNFDQTLDILDVILIVNIILEN